MSAQISADNHGGHRISGDSRGESEAGQTTAPESSGARSTFSRFTRYFIEVARCGSIRKASDVLHVSASAIDRQILKAEEEQ